MTTPNQPAQDAGGAIIPEVKRYQSEGYEVVLAGDYDQLKAECERLREESTLFTFKAANELNDSVNKLAEAHARIAELESLIARSNLKESDGVQSTQDLCGKPILKPCGKILVHKGHVAEVEQHTRDLQKMANMARRVAELEGRVASYARESVHQDVVISELRTQLASAQADTGRLDRALTWAQAALHNIQQVATAARKEYSSQGHYCEFRSALDSVCDRAANGLKNSLSASTPPEQPEPVAGVEPGEGYRMLGDDEMTLETDAYIHDGEMYAARAGLTSRQTGRAYYRRRIDQEGAR